MGSISQILIISMAASISFSAYSNDEDLVYELYRIKQIMSDRQSRIDKSLSDIQKSKLNKDDFVIQQLPHEKINFEGVPLKCSKTRFPWLGKQDGYEYEDCIFKLNIKSDADIKSMMITIGRRTLDGWEIDRTELSSQKNLRAEKVLNKEKYRFKRKIGE
ncbi:MAG: hypothetical protein ACJAXJ_003541 [Colwellia sp.]|jgi:hypothetical protein